MSVQRLYVLLVGAALLLFSPELFAEAVGIDPQTALRYLTEGNARFVSGYAVHPNQSLARRRETADNGQKPYATILSCSDSRVAPEFIFDAGIGDLFVVRVAGNVIDVDETGSIEYGAGHLSTPVLVVLGHMKCGAVTAVVKGDKVGGSIPRLVSKIQPAAAKGAAAEKDPGAETVDKVIRLNVFQSIEDLIKHSAEVREKIKAGHLRVVGAYYRIDTGAVEWLGPHPQEDAILEAAEHADTPQYRWRMFGIAQGILFLGLLIAFFLFVREKRLFKFYRIRGRIIAAFISVVAGASVMLIVQPEAPAPWKAAEFVASPLIACLFGVIYTASIIGSMKKAIAVYKERAQQGQE